MVKSPANLSGFQKINIPMPQVKELIKQGKIEEAIESMISSNDFEVYESDLVSLMSNFQSSKMDSLRGLISSEMANVNHNRITKALLAILSGEYGKYHNFNIEEERLKFNLQKEHSLKKPQFVENEEQNFSYVASVPAGFETLDYSSPEKAQQIESLSWCYNEYHNDQYDLFLTNSSFTYGTIIWKIDFKTQKIYYVTSLQTKSELRQVQFIGEKAIVAIEGDNQISIWKCQEDSTNRFGLTWIKEIVISPENDKSGYDNVFLHSYAIYKDIIYILSYPKNDPLKTTVYYLNDLEIDRDLKIYLETKGITKIKIIGKFYDAPSMLVAYKNVNHESSVIVNGHHFPGIRDVAYIHTNRMVIGSNNDHNVKELDFSSGKVKENEVYKMPMTLLPNFDFLEGEPHERLFTIFESMTDAILILELLGNYEHNYNNAFGTILDRKTFKGINKVKWSGKLGGKGIYSRYHSMSDFKTWHNILEKEYSSWVDWNNNSPKQHTYRWDYRLLASADKAGVLAIWHAERTEKPLLLSVAGCNPVQPVFEWMQYGDNFIAYADTEGFVHILKSEYDPKTPEKEKWQELLNEKNRIEGLQFKAVAFVVLVILSIYFLNRFKIL